MAHSCDRIVRTLRETGVTVDVAHFSTRHDDWRVEPKRNGRHFQCPVREDAAHALNRLWNVLENDHAARSLTTHVVAFGGLLPLMAAPIYAAWLGVPLLTLVRGNDFDAGIFSLKRGDVLREALTRAAHVCAVSRDKVEKIKALYPLARVSCVPNGIDLTDWQLTLADRQQAADWRQAHVEPGRRVLGLFGHLKRKKGGLFFLEALLRSGHARRFHLLLVGEIEAEMTEWLTAHQTEIAFTPLPFLDRYELLPYYAACELIVLPSFYDGLPNVLLEAAGLGIPALASRAGGMADHLITDQHAILFRPGEAHDCRQAITQAANMSDEQLRRMGDNCSSLAATAFDHRVEAHSYESILRHTLDRATPISRFDHDDVAPACSPAALQEAEIA